MVTIMVAIDTIRRSKSISNDRDESAANHSGRFVRVIRSFGRWIDHLIERRRSRMALLEMTDDQLNDINVSRIEARLEASRPFWN